MDNNDKKVPFRFPDEMPSGEKKQYNHGAIENVVRNEIDIKPATNPAKPHSTDALNTEFAKNRQNQNM